MKRLQHAALACALLGLALAGGLASRQGLWVDEIFSLGLASGHSLEHRDDLADPDYGDFELPASPRRAGEYASYTSPQGGAGRVARAVLFSDTNPPAYYLLLHYWLRLFGAGDWALRGFSLACFLACFYPLWLLGRRLAGRRAAVLACAFFALSPLAQYYAGEGRMYSLLWLEALWLAEWSQRWARRFSFERTLAWCGLAGLGLCTHYFFFLPWLACAIHVYQRAGRMPALWAAAGSLGFFLPWASIIPASLSSWRVTMDWLTGPYLPVRALIAPLAALNLFSAQELAVPAWWQAGAALAAGVCVWAGLRLPKARLPLAWTALSLLGPALLDLIFSSHAATVPRYSLPALPAAALLFGAAWFLIPIPARAGTALGLALAWGGAWHSLAGYPGRNGNPLREAALETAARLKPGDLVLVHALPSGLLGIARYLPPDTPLAGWVSQYPGTNLEDLPARIAGSRRVFVVTAHPYDRRYDATLRLRKEALVVDGFQRGGILVEAFAPSAGIIFPDVQNRRPWDLNAAPRAASPAAPRSRAKMKRP